MANFIRISEAASLALHTAAYLAQHDDRMVSSREIAHALGASENHLSKVLQRLGRSGIVKSLRGPSGGFKIRTPWQKIRLIEVYESIEGPIQPQRCLLDLPCCMGKRCALGLLVRRTDEAARKCFSDTTLAHMVKNFRANASSAAPRARRSARIAIRN